MLNNKKQIKMTNLEVTGVRYQDTRRGVSYVCTTNVPNVLICNDGQGGATFIEGHIDAKPYQHLNEFQLEELINKFENIQ
tara:strand:- start:7294 stop:7533 length:240 start_codon:yes stop_codon:yes gene_type:complete